MLDAVTDHEGRIDLARQGLLDSPKNILGTFLSNGQAESIGPFLHSCKTSAQ
jgi:hypothetical protein